ncbi:solute carrier family 13 member 5 [Daphnia magna]|uniref:solute carrier family 13 member 5 n=1 Tax=Daphnia magna TaxID=35525 RepID=UPI00140241DC|nr:solute carrier family 13 member 5 [Daphnia magna]XP_045030624.1 solute carrier family 13 member 5 [Daphnia magna]
MGLIETLRFRVLPYWKTYVLVLLPLILLPLPVIGQGKEARAGYVIIIMAVFWMTEALPLAITSLLPVVLFPLLGIMGTGKVCTAYMKETNMMFIGGLMVALTIEHCNLHKRIALRVLLLVGASPRWLMLGFMLTTMFLSMWISNTATTAMMVPIVEAVVQELFKDGEEEMKREPNVRMVPDGMSTCSSNNTLEIDLDSSESQNLEAVSIDSIADVGKSCQELTAASADQRSYSCTTHEYKQTIRTCVLMSIAYSSNIGGTGSLIGSSPQLALKGILDELYGSAPGLNFASWMAFNVPGMLINTFLAWIWLQCLFLGFKRTTADDNTQAAVIKKLIRRKYEELGPMTFHELATLILFILCVALWFFRDPQFITGWAEFLPAVEVDDATAVMTIVLLLFIIPAKPRFWNRDTAERNRAGPSPALLEWKLVQDRLPWGIVLLLGGGFALSDASKASGLSSWLGDQLAVLSFLPPFAIMLIICIMTAAVTEVASNTATANILLPILAEMAVTIKVNPLFLMLPATVTCSYAFMLPVATPPNAIVFAAGRMNPTDMVKAGLLMNIVCVVVICVLMASFGSFMFGFDEFPDWAVPQVKNATMTTLSQFSNCTSP